MTRKREHENLGKREPKRGRALIVAGAALVAASVVVAAAGLLFAGKTHYEANAREPEAADMEPANPIDWDYWLSVNPDIVGWVEVPGTDIDQPILQASTADPEYYLSHDAYGAWNPYGCAFLDSGCERGMDSWNLVVTGHNISYPPAVFHDVENYHDQEFASKHSTVNVYTPTEVRRYALAGVDTIDGSETLKRTAFSSAKDYVQYRDSLLEASDQKYEVPDGLSQMLTLCSCSYFRNPWNERTLVYSTIKEAHVTASTDSTEVE